MRQALPNRKMQSIKYVTHTNHQACQHARRLQGVCPDNCFDTTLVGVEQDHHKDNQGRHPERHVQAIENGILQNLHHQIQPRGGTKRA